MRLLQGWVDQLDRIDNGWVVSWRNSERKGRSYLTSPQVQELFAEGVVTLAD